MPGMTGLELLPKAKAARPDVPVIMITAYGDAETKHKALAGGAEALFTEKPVDFGALRNEIEPSRTRRLNLTRQTYWLECPLMTQSGHEAPTFRLPAARSPMAI